MDPDQRDARSLEEGLEEGEIEESEMGLLTTIILLFVITVLVAITAVFLVDSIDGLTSSGHISKGFVSLILLPNVANAADHAIIILGSLKRDLNTSLGAAMGSSIQMALFVIPFVVILGWILGKPLTLLFDPLESIVLFLSGGPYQLSLQPGCPLMAFLVSFNRQLRCTRWQIKLARGHDPHMPLCNNNSHILVLSSK